MSTMIDVRRFFNTVLSEAVVYPEQAALFRSLGFDPEDWPPCEARGLMLEFQALVKEKGEDAARFIVSRKLEALETNTRLTEDQGEMTLKYDQFKTLGHALFLSDRLRNSPYELDQIVDDFRRRRVTKVESFLLHEVIDTVLSEEAKQIEKGEIRVLIPTWEKLSKKIGGFNPGRVSVLVAITGLGKTMVALNLASCASQHMGTLFINMEMPKKDIVARLIQSGARIKSEDWYTGHWNFATIGEFRDRTAAKKPFILTDGRALTLNQIIGQIIIAKEKYGIQFVVVDYDQKIRMGGRDEEWRQLQRAVEDLEECAKANNIHIMLLSQGDDEGAMKASKRAQQPAATIFEFYERNGKYLLRSRKNRFGARKWHMKVNADPSMSLVTEGEITDEAQLELDVAKDGGKPRPTWWGEKNDE